MRCDTTRLGCDCDAMRYDAMRMQCETGEGNISKVTNYRQSPDPTTFVFLSVQVHVSPCKYTGQGREGMNLTILYSLFFLIPFSLD